jgi:hypothetical protein
MRSMWTALSDLDYYGVGQEDLEPEACDICGAHEHEACEEWCPTNLAAEEPEDLECPIDLLDVA